MTALVLASGRSTDLAGVALAAREVQAGPAPALAILSGRDLPRGGHCAHTLVCLLPYALCRGLAVSANTEICSDRAQQLGLACDQGASVSFEDWSLSKTRVTQSVGERRQQAVGG